MAVPKSKVSKQRRNKRAAATFTMSAPNLVECPQCHTLKRSHAVCPECGYYDGKEVIAPKAQKAQKADN